MRTPKEIRQGLTAALTSILNDEEAAGWVIRREQDKVEELRRRFPGRSIALVSFDVDKIKDFVFTSTRPLEVQGASEIVNDLTLEKPRKGDNKLPNCSVYQILIDEGLSADNVLFAGGGTGLLLLPADKAEKVAEQIRSRFASASQTGSVSVVWELFCPWELLNGSEIESQKSLNLLPGVTIAQGNGINGMPFGHLVRLLADRLREEKGHRLFAIIPPLPGYVRRCDSCGIRAAERLDRPREEENWLCSSCFFHRQRGRKELNRLKDHNPELQTAESINDIVREQERGYVAFIYADANDMGQKLFKMPRMEDYATLSNAVTTVFDKLREDIVKNFQLKGRYQAPILGGDDLFFIVPAAKAAPIVAYLMQVTERFGREAATLQGEAEAVAQELRDITLSVGFTIVPSHFNIRFSVDYAEALLRKAKEARHDKGGEPCVDWMVIKDGSPLSLEVEELRRTIYTRRTRDWTLKLCAKPVTVQEFNQMMTWIECLNKAKISRYQLKVIQDLLEKDSPRSARLNIRYQWLRVKEWKDGFFRGDIVQGERWLKEFVLKEPQPVYYETGFLDLMELYEFQEVSV
jgi:hypothetical protein